MVRDFTDEAKEKLISQISDIEANDWCWFTDWIGDLSFNIQKWAGLLSLKEDMSNVEEYHKAVLDMNNMKSIEIENIFESVYGEEYYVEGQLKEVNEKLQIIAKNMRKLADGIGTGFVSADAATIQKIGKELKADLKNVNSVLTEFQNKEETRLLASLAKEQAKEMIGDCLSVLVDIAVLPEVLVAHLLARGRVGLWAEWGSQTWDILNHSFAVMESITATGFALIGLGAGAIGWEEARYEAYKVSKENSELDGLTDYFEKESEKDSNSILYKGLTIFAKGFDVANGGYKIVDTGIDWVTDISKPKSVKDASETKKLLGFEFGEKEGMTWEEYHKSYKGTINDWKKFNDVYSKMENEGKKISNIKSAYELAEGFGKDVFGDSRENNTVESAINQTIAGKVISVSDKVTEFIKEHPSAANKAQDFFNELGNTIYFCGLE